MPLISVEAAGVSSEQKKELIRTLSREASRIMNVPIDEFRVFIKEYPAENIGIGDMPLTELFKARGKQD